MLLHTAPVYTTRMHKHPQTYLLDTGEADTHTDKHTDRHIQTSKAASNVAELN